MTASFASRAARAVSVLALALAFAGSAGATPIGKTVVADVLLVEALAVEGGSPAEGLRAAARRSFGTEPTAKRVVPSTFTAEALYARITTPL